MPADVLPFANQHPTNLDTILPPPDRAIEPADILPSLPLRVYDPTSSSGRIDPRQPRTEFELQAWLYNRLNLDGFDVRGEIRGRTDAGRNARFDLIVSVGDRVIAIIEVKDTPGSRLEKTGQGRRYRTFGVPVFLFFNENQYSQLRARLAALMQNIAQPGHEHG
jgi:hypothetical protein